LPFVQSFSRGADADDRDIRARSSPGGRRRAEGQGDKHDLQPCQERYQGKDRMASQDSHFQGLGIRARSCPEGFIGRAQEMDVIFSRSLVGLELHHPVSAFDGEANRGGKTHGRHRPAAYHRPMGRTSCLVVDDHALAEAGWHRVRRSPRSPGGAQATPDDPPDQERAGPHDGRVTFARCAACPAIGAPTPPSRPETRGDPANQLGISRPRPRVARDGALGLQRRPPDGMRMWGHGVDLTASRRQGRLA